MLKSFWTATVNHVDVSILNFQLDDKENSSETVISCCAGDGERVSRLEATSRANQPTEGGKERNGVILHNSRKVFSGGSPCGRREGDDACENFAENNLKCLEGI